MIHLEEFTKFKSIDNVVLGGAGFLGSHLVDRLLDDGQNVLCIDDLSSGKLENLNHLKDCQQFKYIKHNIVNAFYSKLPIKRVWHLASPAAPNIYQDNPLNTIKINYEGTLNALQLAKDHSSKFLFTSTSEIYGMTLTNPQYENMPINLSTSSPRACYSEGKRIAETLIKTFSDIYKLDTRIARIFNTYGPRISLDDGRVMGSFIKQGFCNKELTIFGDGLQTRSFCFVEDLIDGLTKLMDSGYINPMNLGNQEEIRILDLAILIKNKINPALNFKFLNLPKDDPILRKPSLDKASYYLNWKPKVSLSNGLNKTISFYKNLFK